MPLPTKVRSSRGSADFDESERQDSPPDGDAEGRELVPHQQRQDESGARRVQPMLQLTIGAATQRGPSRRLTVEAQDHGDCPGHESARRVPFARQVDEDDPRPSQKRRELRLKTQVKIVTPKS